jgi:hypothetical protein
VTTQSMRRRPARREQPGPQRQRVSHGAGFWIVAAAFTTLMAFGTAPTPLWPLYEARDNFGSTTVTVAFAVMVVGAAGSLFFLGHLSDRLGRRRIIVPALIVALAAAVTLLTWPQLPGLLVGRLLTGIAIGLMASTATAYLADLHRAEHPGAPGSKTPGLVATAANLGGLALGPLVAGILAQWAPDPLTTPYVVFGALLLIALLLILVSPETVDRELQAELRPAKFALQRGTATTFAGAAAVGFVAFAVMGLFSSLGAVIIRGDLGITSHFIGGLAAFAVFALSATAQLALARLTVPRMLTAGAVTFPVGLALVAAAMYHPSLWLYLLGAAVSGAGAGLLFKGAITTSATVAVPGSRAGVLAVYFVIAYLGMGAPSIILTVVDKVVSPKAAMIGFAVVLSAGAALAVWAAVAGYRSRIEASR